MNLLILDIDETLLYATGRPLERDPDAVLESYHVYLRPYLAEFLAVVSGLFEVAIWTSASETYAREVVPILPLPEAPRFVWSHDRCTRRFNPETQTHYFLKDLKKVARLGYDLNRVIIVDNTPRKIARQYGNLVRVVDFTGSPQDDELRLLSLYLPQLSERNDIRSIEKRGWRDQVRGG